MWRPKWFEDFTHESYWSVHELRRKRMAAVDAGRARSLGVSVVVPALYNYMPAEAVALGWLNEIDALGAIRHRILDSTKLTGWDVFTFHTRHNLDPFYASTIAAVRETWLREGTLKPSSIAETVKHYGAAYQYNRISPRSSRPALGTSAARR